MGCVGLLLCCLLVGHWTRDYGLFIVRLQILQIPSRAQPFINHSQRRVGALLLMECYLDDLLQLHLW